MHIYIHNKNNRLADDGAVPVYMVMMEGDDTLMHQARPVHPPKKKNNKNVF